jgi:hypothetical protein
MSEAVGVTMLLCNPASPSTSLCWDLYRISSFFNSFNSVRLTISRPPNSLIKRSGFVVQGDRSRGRLTDQHL